MAKYFFELTFSQIQQIKKISVKYSQGCYFLMSGENPDTIVYKTKFQRNCVRKLRKHRRYHLLSSCVLRNAMCKTTLHTFYGQIVDKCLHNEHLNVTCK